MHISRNKIFIFLFPLVFIASLGIAIIRDIRNLEDGYACDLRKRIVGSRYQAAGLSPYYYKWKPGQPEEFCNPYESGPDFLQNVVTLPPSYLWVLQPISKLGFHTIEIIWFIVQYLFLLSIFGLFLWNIKELQYRYILLTVFSLFFFSKGWITNVDIGQSYILFPLLWSVAFFLKNKKVKAYFFAGALLAVCCWLRPVCILMVLPFLVSDKRASFLKGFIIIGCLCILQLLLFHQYENWQDFFHSSFQWGKYYNTLGPASSTDFGNGKWPSTIEGQSDFHITAIPQYTANLPIVASSLFNIHIKSLWYIVLFFILATTIIFSVYKKRTQLKLDTIWISSFVIYYLSEVFVSVPKPSYYFVELIFPICIMVGSKSIFKNRTGLALLLLGLCLSTFAIRLIPMQLLIGEYLVFISLLFFLSNQLKIKQQIINQ